MPVIAAAKNSITKTPPAISKISMFDPLSAQACL
jgi:hypothetical protein